MIRVTIITVLCSFVSVSAWAASPLLEIAWKRGGSAQYFLLPEDGQCPSDQGGTPLESKLTTPLGSLWKLFVYTYLVDRGIDVPEYVCNGFNSKEEAYCCDVGKRIGPDEALAQSCGLFFEPSRLQIMPQDWQAYWRPFVLPSAQWLMDLARLQPETKVSVVSLLDALAAIPPHPRQQAEHALVSLLFTSRAEGVVPYFGGRLHVKTWTWDHPTKKGLRVGGFAGWLVDGTPIWARGEGSSGQILRRWSPVFSHWLDTLPEQQEENECVIVKFFASYPLKHVVDLETSQPVRPGALDGRYRVDFQNGNHLRIHSQGELNLSEEEKGLRITGRLGLNEYVARVLDREAAAEPIEAAKALAIVVRSYLLQNAALLRGCYQIDDSSRTQRVSPNPPSDAARRIAAWTDSLVVKGAPVQYHHDRPSPNTLAWMQAVVLAREKRTFDQILADAYPGSSVASMYGGGGDCQRMPEAERWLHEHSQRWQRILAREPGFEVPPTDLTVCHLKYGNPYSDFGHKRIYVRGLQTSNDRIAIAHEYVHLGFRLHPLGIDERFVEKTARELVGE